MSADREVVATNTTPVPAGGTGAAAVPEALPAGVAHTPGVCANCGAPLPGHYCANCGQKAEHAVHSLRHFLSEVAEDLTHADSRLWLTLEALVFKPGFLTCEFLAGRRARYLPPFRLYLVMSVLFFLVVAFNTALTDNGQPPETLAQAQARATSEEDKEALKAMSEKYPIFIGAGIHEHGEKACADLPYDGPWKERVGPLLRASCVRVVRDQHEVRAEFLHNLPRAIFLLLPILALLLKPLYRRPPRYLVEHLLFLLHNHALLYLAFGLLGFVDAFGASDAVTDPLFFAVVLYIPYYYYRGMRRVYGEGTARTLGKLTVLSLAYAVLAVVVLVVTAIYSVLVLKPA